MATDHAGKVLELVVFKLNEGVTREQFLATNDAVSAWAKTQPGFVSRDCLYATEQDKWVDVIYWETMKQAHAAAEAAQSHDECKPFFNLIDMENDMLFLHAEPAITSEVA